jgi:protocatechuate 3,4-dioxygenase, beta subunit
MKSPVFLLLFLLPCLNACGQDRRDIPVAESRTVKKVGGPCEGCEAIYEYGDRKLSWIDTLPDFSRKGIKLEIEGTVYQAGTRKPARDVIVYIYHTDPEGNYSNPLNETGWGKRHGSWRGWAKTNAEGKYKFYTLKPGSYPGSRNPAHIHMTIKEPDKSEYYIDDILFDDDPLLTKEERNRLRGLGGPGVVRPVQKEKGYLSCRRDILLGENIAGY